MKKKLTVMAFAIACMFAFASCEDNPFTHVNVADGALGEVNLVASNPVAGQLGNQMYADGDSIHFSSALCNVATTLEQEIIQGVTVEITVRNTIMVGLEKELTEIQSESDVELPIFGLNLRDTVVGNYPFTCPMHDFGFVTRVKELFSDGGKTNWLKLITQGDSLLGNIFVIAADENGIYLAYDGSLDVTAFAAKNGNKLEGTFNNVKAAYIAFDAVEDLSDMTEAERNAIGDLTLYFPTITFNGELTSRRSDPMMNTVISAIENQ